MIRVYHDIEGLGHMKCEIKVGMLLLEDVIGNGTMVLQMFSNNLRQITKKPQVNMIFQWQI